MAGVSTPRTVAVNFAALELVWAALGWAVGGWRSRPFSAHKILEALALDDQWLCEVLVDDLAVPSERVGRTVRRDVPYALCFFFQLHESAQQTQWCQVRSVRTAVRQLMLGIQWHMRLWYVCLGLV